jgi:acyl-CoA synthetase (AMP-forming)/AMP-acid ligase II
LRDRSNDVPIGGGSNIYPRQVEQALLEHPVVAKACVVGAPDGQLGEIVVALIVGVGGSGATCDEFVATLDAHLQERIARFERPKRYEFLALLPENSYQKVRKRVLRRSSADIFDSRPGTEGKVAFRLIGRGATTGDGDPALVAPT